MKKIYLLVTIACIVLLIIFTHTSCTQSSESKPLTKEQMIERGHYLVEFGGCHDCHSPKVYTDMGPVPDTTQLLSGYHDDGMLPAGDPQMVQPGKWVMTDKNFSAWVGPWGISYAANLTPDNATGLGAESEEMFIKTLRDGKLKGVGRPLLPPMPWPGIGSISDEDLKCIYAFLRTIKPIHNQVPQPVPPDKIGEVLAKK